MKTFFFSSKSGELYLAHVYRLPLAKEFHICVCDKEKVQIGEARLSYGDERLRYIFNLYVDNEFRRESIGSYMIQIIDYLIKSWKYKNIYGVLEPFELKLDNFDRDELLARDIRFYKRNHFDIIKYSDYLFSFKYDLLDESYFGYNRTKTLVYRNYVPQDYLFNDVGDIAIHNSVIMRLDEIEEFLDNKLARLHLKVQ